MSHNVPSIVSLLAAIRAKIRKRVFDFEETIPLRIRIGFDQRVDCSPQSTSFKSDAPCFYSTIPLLLSQPFLREAAKTMVRLCWKPARLAVRILCLSYLAQKLSSRKRERERGGGRVERKKEWTRHCSYPTFERRDSVGRLTVAKVLPVKERAVVFFDELVAGLNSGMQRNETRNASNAETRKSEVRFPGTIPLTLTLSRISFSAFITFTWIFTLKHVISSLSSLRYKIHPPL